ncbi:4-hydroxybenzoate octaprenyltransferase [Thalassotalea ponticola]
MDKPIGTYLLLWPTYWSLVVAANGFPGWHLIAVFTLGVFIMRSAGCVINDYADRRVDGHVKRTANRPLVSGMVTERQALALFTGLITIAFVLVMTLSWSTILLSLVALLLAFCYPFMKRYTHFPQVVLGAAFSWGMIMAFNEINGQITTVAWLLFFANLAWTVAYDTIYAMVDRDDDIKIGIKSTAIFFARFDKLAIALLQLLALTMLVKVGQLEQFDGWYYMALALVAASFVYQHRLIANRERDKCFSAFLNNHWGLLIILLGLISQYMF